MSRSEHATRRDPRDPGDLRRKRRIKALIDEERARPRTALPSGGAAAVPIEVRAAGPFVQFPASEEDLRAVLARIPAECATGLGRIELCLEGPDDDDTRAPDPFLGRLRRQVMPGVYSGRYLGQYVPWGATLRLFAYVYDRAMPLGPIVATYLRLRMLATFVHELGHHQDYYRRVARGRWRADDIEEVEMYAEAIEYAWTREYVIPYLEARYPSELDALRLWLVTYGGSALPLETLGGDPRMTRSSDGIPQFFRVDSAFERLVEAVSEGLSPRETRLRFAKCLYYGKNYAEALTILARVLEAHPQDAAALVLRAEIYEEQHRLDDAEAIARDVIARDADDADAWRVLRRVARDRGDWSGVLVAAIEERRINAATGHWRWRECVEHEVRARIERGEWTHVAEGLATLREDARSESCHARVAMLSALMLARQGRHAEAQEIAAALQPDGSLAHEVVALRFECARQMGLPGDESRLPPALEHLRAHGYALWADRLEAMGASP